MFSRLRFFYKNRRLLSILKLKRVKFPALPNYYCNTATCAEKRFSIDDLDAQLFCELTSVSECPDNFNDIVEEIQLGIANKRRFPTFLNSDQIQILLSLETRTQRKDYLAFLFRKERLKIADAEKREKKRKERESWEPKPKRYSAFENGIIRYGLGGNSLLLNVRLRSINKFYDKKLANASLFGRKIVLDLGYDEHMTEKEQKHTAIQLQLVYSSNRRNYDPYDMYFCNTNDASRCVRYLRRDFVNLADSLITVTDKNYLDVLPKEKLVYLSPHAEETLKEYDHDAIYIIGAFVDTTKQTKVSFSKAEKEGIKSYALPLDEYIMWGAGSKSLTINQVFDIMLVLKNTGDWIKAFQVIPNRKIRRIDPQLVESQKSSNKIFLTDTTKNKEV